jgi:hypothetical protein
MRTLAVTAFLLLIAHAGIAAAIPAPMSDDQLLAESDLVALIQVVSVTCLSVYNDPASGEALPSYSARVKLLEVMKGDEAEGDEVNIRFSAVPSGVLGPWTVFYYPGERVWTHLVQDGGAYTSTWWNARKQVLQKAVVKTLPTRPGETVSLPGAK